MRPARARRLSATRGQREETIAVHPPFYLVPCHASQQALRLFSGSAERLDPDSPDMNSTTRARIEARDASMRLLNQITSWVAFGALAGVAVLGGIAAATIPGTASSTQGSGGASTSSSSGNSSSSTSTSDLQASRGVSSSSSTPVVVSGGSR